MHDGGVVVLRRGGIEEEEEETEEGEMRSGHFQWEGRVRILFMILGFYGGVIEEEEKGKEERQIERRNRRR